VKNDYPSLSEKAMKFLLPIATTSSCETWFSAVAVMKTKHRSLLIITEKETVAISSMTSRFGKLYAEKQAHQSHWLRRVKLTAPQALASGE
jgi:hypothetical protein